MSRSFPLLLVSLLVLLIAACKKDDAQPEASLEGTWTLHRAYHRFYKTANGAITSEAPIPQA